MMPIFRFDSPGSAPQRVGCRHTSSARARSWMRWKEGVFSGRNPVYEAHCEPRENRGKLLPSMARGGKTAIGLLGVALACFATNALTADQPSRKVFTYRNDRLSVHLAQVPLQEVMVDLGQASGAEIYGTVREPRDVSAEFDDVPLVEALHRLLGDQNVVVKYGKGGRLRAVRLLGGPQESVQLVAAPTSPASEPVPAPSKGPLDLGGTLAIFDGHPPVPVSGQLGQALGRDKATFRDLFDAASQNEDASVRAEAMRAFIGALDAEPELRDPVLRLLATLDDSTLTEMLRGLMGSRAEEFAAQFAANAHVSDLSSRAWGIFLRLGAPQDTATKPSPRPAA